MADGSTFRAPRGYDPYSAATLAGIADYDGDRETWEHDHLITCECGFRSTEVDDFDPDIRETDGVWVCREVCTVVREAPCDELREYGTLYARNGAVVG